MNDKAKIYEFPPDKTIEIKFLNSLTTDQLLVFWQIMDNITIEADKYKSNTLNHLLLKKNQFLKKEVIKLRKVIGRLKHQHKGKGDNPTLSQ